MTELRNYLEAHRYLRVVLLGIGFIGASIALYMGMALSVFVRGADSLLILSLVVLALALNAGVGWTLHLHSVRGLWATILLSSSGILLGAVLTSMAVWRGHWLELIRELFGTMR